MDIDECVYFDLEAFNVTRVWKRMLNPPRRKQMQYLFTSKKSSAMGLPLAFFAAVGGYFALQQGIPALVVGCYYIMMGLVVGSHMIAYGMADSAAISSGKEKE